jgi:hypothetical protein
VRDSHFATNDVLMTALVAAAALQSVRYVERPSDGRLIFAAALAGLAAGTKYNGGIAMASVVAAAVVATLPGRATLLLRRLVVCTLAGLIAFVASNPATLLDPHRVLNGFLAMASLGRHAWLGQDQRPIPFLILRTILLGSGVAATLCALWGVAMAVRASPRTTIVIAMTPLAYLAFLLHGEAFGARLIVLVLPFVATFSGAGAEDALSRLRKSIPMVRGTTWTAIVVAIVIAEPVSRSAYFDLLLTRTDDRREVEQWLEARTAVLASAVIDSRTAAAFVSPLPQGTTVVAPGKLATAQSLSEILQPGKRYVVLSYVTTQPEYDLIWRTCQARGSLVAEFSPFRVPGRTPTADDILAPFDDIFAWRRPGLLVRIFDFGPDGRGL